MSNNIALDPVYVQYERLLAENKRLREALKKSLERMNALDIALCYDAGLAKEVFVHMQQEVKSTLLGYEEQE